MCASDGLVWAMTGHCVVPACVVCVVLVTYSFLIGGGCNERNEYVELLVDGDVMFVATGACSETMARVHWDVALHTGRTGQVRVVDASTGMWGHINVDDFRFDWPMQVLAICNC